MVKRSQESPESQLNLYAIMAVLQRTISHRSVANKIKISQFSDCIFASLDRSDYSLLFKLLMHLHVATIGLGLFIRGGITTGDIFHNQDTIFGPGVITAYELESKHAIYPRIIFDHHFAKELRTRTPKAMNTMCRESEDGFTYYNSIELMNFELFNSALLKAKILNKQRASIVKGIEQNKGNTRVLSKYLWLKNHFNNTCRSNPELDVSTIEFI